MERKWKKNEKEYERKMRGNENKWKEMKGNENNWKGRWKAMEGTWKENERNIFKKMKGGCLLQNFLIKKCGILANRIFL